MTKYTERQISDLQTKLDALKLTLSAEDEAILGSTSVYKVGCSENNSGGSFWLCAEDYDGLEMKGFTVFRDNRGFYKEVMAPDEDIAIHLVKEDFYEATNYTGDEEGCNCCGQPFYFDAHKMGDEHYEFWWEAVSDRPNIWKAISKQDF